MSDDDFEIRPGRVRDRSSRSAKPKSLASQIRALSNKSGYVGITGHRGRATGRHARGRSAALAIRAHRGQRRVLVKARVVRHHGSRFSAAPLLRHIAYLKREGVSRDGADAAMFGNHDERADGTSFAERCADDRHHFRFIVSPEDAGELADVRAFTRELLSDMEADLGTRLDWVAVDHWNTDNPHIHILLRGKTENGQDLVIDKDYIREGMRGRAEARVTVELGLRSEHQIDQALAREVTADRLTSLDRRLQRMADNLGGVIDLRPAPPRPQSSMDRHLIGRAAKLERLGLATRIAAACWTLKHNLEPTLRQLGVRGDIIKAMHHAMNGVGINADPGRFFIHLNAVEEPVIGRLVERGLHDELTGEAYAVIDGADGQVHHLRFGDLDLSSDATPGAIVELKSWTDRRGRPGQSLWVQSDLPLDEQIIARGCTWLDRQLVSSDPVQSLGGFGSAIEQAKADRTEYLISQGLAARRGGRVVMDRGLLSTLRSRELAEACGAITAQTGLPHRPSAEGDVVSGIYRERLQLATGRFAMIDDGLCFELVPWRPQLDRQLGQHISGIVKAGGGIDWTLGRSRTLGV
ncbi:relaxase/mobilization nuclease domain-containing protein [Sphingorhabdus profundilacus]|uniref:relaxase/mobilization nuclease domain-containing protein n=1 Tax=Sphingorhabdus profundilacus TaxID=2509718 RepID=UPI003CCDE216